MKLFGKATKERFRGHSTLISGQYIDACKRESSDASSLGQELCHLRATGYAPVGRCLIAYPDVC